MHFVKECPVKTVVIIVAVAMMLAFNGEAQTSLNFKTCRAHRDTWMASRHYDLKHLPVQQLVERSDELATCMSQVDSNLEENAETANIASEIVQRAEYQTLALLYYREAFTRISKYLDSKNLLQDFKQTDRQTSSQSK
jgi:hypothetical protein